MKVSDNDMEETFQVCEILRLGSVSVAATMALYFSTKASTVTRR
jgi:hypothetical protein